MLKFPLPFLVYFLFILYARIIYYTVYYNNSFVGIYLLSYKIRKEQDRYSYLFVWAPESINEHPIFQFNMRSQSTPTAAIREGF
jgi:hypothetical protein